MKEGSSQEHPVGTLVRFRCVECNAPSKTISVMPQHVPPLNLVEEARAYDGYTCQRCTFSDAPSDECCERLARIYQEGNNVTCHNVVYLAPDKRTVCVASFVGRVSRAPFREGADYCMEVQLKMPDPLAAVPLRRDDVEKIPYGFLRAYCRNRKRWYVTVRNEQFTTSAMSGSKHELHAPVGYGPGSNKT